MVVPAICCCGCDYLIDSFDRTAENIDPDGVNIITSTRWEFTDGDWIVGVGTGRLLCETDGSPILFYNNSAGIFLNPICSVTLYEQADTVSLLLGATEIKLSFPAADTVRVEYVGGDHWEHVYGSAISFPRSGTFGFKMVDKETFSTSCNPYGVDVIAIVGSLVPGLEECLVQLADYTVTEFYQYGMKATEGVTFESINVVKSKPTCSGIVNMHCRTSCYPSTIPDTLTVTIGGLSNNPKFQCIDLTKANQCTDSLSQDCDDCLALTSPDDCLADCALMAPGPARDACEQACWDERAAKIAACNEETPTYDWTQYATHYANDFRGGCWAFNSGYCEVCYKTYAHCRDGCNCEEVNGDYILTRETVPLDTGPDADPVTSTWGDCSCIYFGRFTKSLDHYPSDVQNGDCCITSNSCTSVLDGSGHLDHYECEADCVESTPTVADSLEDDGKDRDGYMFFRVEYSVAFYDCDTGELHYNLNWLMHPFTSIGPAATTTPLKVPDFCNGTIVHYGVTQSTSVGVSSRDTTTGLYAVSPGSCQCFASPIYAGPCGTDAKLGFCTEDDMLAANKPNTTTTVIESP